MNQKIINLARKLKALADRGVGGEKETAYHMLTRLMKQHGITFDDIDGIERVQHEFFVNDNQYKFFRQVVASVIGAPFSVFHLKGDRRKRKPRFIDCTNAEAVEIQAKFDFFWRAYQEEENIFYRAFVQKNHLYTKPDNSDQESEAEELSDEERVKLWKISQMMTGMDHHHFAKQIGDGK